jgi:putative membrane protein
MNNESTTPPMKGISYFKLGLKGFCMGAADVVPGVSGGTMAFILGIYEELILGISSINYEFFRRLFSGKLREAFNCIPWKFLTAVGVGILCAGLSLARLLSWLLHNQPVLIWSFFFGLITGSLFTVSRRIRKWRPGILLGIVLGAAGTYTLVGLVPLSTPEAPWFLFISGAVAICAMILPGISGAFILVLMGKYFFVLEAIKNWDFLTFFMVLCGAITGLVTFARFLRWLFERYHDATIAFLTGLMLGSLRKVWPWKEAYSGTGIDVDGASTSLMVNVFPSFWGIEVSLAFVLAIVGLSAVLLLDRSAGARG